MSILRTARKHKTWQRHYGHITTGRPFGDRKRHSADAGKSRRAEISRTKTGDENEEQLSGLAPMSFTHVSFACHIRDGPFSRNWPSMDAKQTKKRSDPSRNSGSTSVMQIPSQTWRTNEESRNVTLYKLLFYLNDIQTVVYHRWRGAQRAIQELFNIRLSRCVFHLYPIFILNFNQRYVNFVIRSTAKYLACKRDKQILNSLIKING